MKTNATPKSVVRAVETVSAEKYENNVIFRKYPQRLTKNVIRFTLRTKDANKPGSLITAAGLKQPKVNWDVHQDVVNEIFKLNPKANIYVDTTQGRFFNEVAISDVENQFEEVSNEQGEETNTSESSTGSNNTPAVRTKRKYTRRAPLAQKGTTKKRKYTKRADKEKPSKTPMADKATALGIKKALKYLMKHPELLG